MGGSSIGNRNVLIGYGYTLMHYLDSHLVLCIGQHTGVNISHQCLRCGCDLHVAAFSLRFRQVDVILISVVFKCCFVFASGLDFRDNEGTSSAMDDGSSRDDLLLVFNNGQSDVFQMFSFSGVGFKSYPAGMSGNESASFRIKTDAEFGFAFLGLKITLQGADSHVLDVFTFFFRLVENRKNAGIKFVIVAEEGGGHGFVVEHVFRPPGVLAFGYTEIEHPTCVCTQFVVAGIK